MNYRNLQKIAGLVFFLLVFSAATVLCQEDGVRQMVVSNAQWQWQSDSDGVTRIPVCWENSQGYSTETEWVKDAIENSWESAANLDFQGWQPCGSGSRGVRILVTDTRSNSYLGKHLDGRVSGMELNFTFQNFSPSCRNKKEFCIKAIAIHEFGHALGLTHEQNNEGSTCPKDEKGPRGGWFVTKYDPYSVMNYCNEKWVNGGVLSELDVVGIQEIYGKRIIPSQSTFSVSDMLGVNEDVEQISENVFMEFYNSGGGSRQFFHLDSNTKEQTRTWNFFASGVYCYKVWSHTFYQDKNERSGYGEGCFTLEKGKNYSLTLYGALTEDKKGLKLSIK